MATPRFTQSVTFLYASDVAASRRFYEGALGLVPVHEQAGGKIAIYDASGGGRGFLGLCPARGAREIADPRTPGGVVFTFVTPDVEDWHARLIAAGAEVLGPPATSAEYGITGFFFRDPDGYLLEIQRFETPAWPAPG